MRIRILFDPKVVAGFVPTVQARADANRKSFGFLPKGAYAEAALQSKLLIAVEEGSDKYAGHLMFGGVWPRVRVFQAYVERRYRRHSIGKKLLKHLVEKLEQSHYLSMTAHVASDLAGANSFYERMGFKLVQTRPGRGNRGRRLNIRVRDLNTPNLFNFQDMVSPADQSNLFLIDRLFRQSPVYVIDLNVLFDVAKRRLRAREAGLVLRAAFQNVARIAVSEEMVEELRRASTARSDDPVLEMVLELPRLAGPEKREADGLVGALSTVVFPERVAQRMLSVQDHSDLIHLATAITHKAAGFVTSEKAILRAREILRREYGLEVVGVSEFAETMSPSPIRGIPLRGSLLGERVSAIELDDDCRANAESLLAAMYVPEDLAKQALAGAADTPLRRVVLIAGKRAIGFGSWTLPPGPKPMCEAFVCIDQDHQAAESAAEYLIGRICKESSRAAPALIRMRHLPGHSVTMQVAMAHGFRPSSEGMVQKIAVGRPIHDGNWGWLRNELYSLARVELPASMPDDALSDLISIETPNGRKVRVRSDDLEVLLSPVLFISRNRAGSVVPVQKKYAEDLLESPQFRMLESPEASFLQERAYFSNPRTASTIPEGGCLLFYESGKDGGQSAIVGIGRIVRVTVEMKDSVSSATRRRGVLKEVDFKDLNSGGRVAVTRFDNLMMLRHPVPIQRLREIGCADGSNFVTAKRMTGEQIAAIVKEGDKRG